MIAWPSGVNKTILAETTWEPMSGIIRDTMRSGKDKRRLSSSSVPDRFTVTMSFSKEEYTIFDAWFKTTLRRGLLSFTFPTLIGIGMSEYLMSDPKYTPAGGQYVNCSMIWETV